MNHHEKDDIFNLYIFKRILNFSKQVYNLLHVLFIYLYIFPRRPQLIYSFLNSDPLKDWNNSSDESQAVKILYYQLPAEA